MPSKQLIEELSRVSTRDIIGKTVETYPADWVAIHETLQNAMDAIQRSRKDSGHISVTMNLDAGEVEISDNGVGFPFNLTLLGFGGTDKSSTDWKFGGEIGVGLKVVIFSSERFQLDATYLDETSGKLRKWNCEINHGSRYLNGQVNDVEVQYQEPRDVSASNTGTVIRYGFPDQDKLVSLVNSIYDDYVGASLVGDHFAVSPNDKFKIAVEHYFRTRGYAASVNNLLGIETTSPTDIDLVIKASQSVTAERLRPGISQYFSGNGLKISFRNRFWDAEEAVSQRTRGGVSRPYVLTTTFPNTEGNIGNYNENYLYVQKFSSWDSYQKLVANQRLRNLPDLTRYQNFFQQHVAGIYLVVGSRENLKKFMIGVPRMHVISASGIPSTHDINPPRDVGELGFVNNIHFVVNLRARLSYGKQSIKNPRLLGTVNEFFRDAFRTTLRNAARGITGTVEPPPTPIVTPSISTVSRPDLGLANVSIRKEPIEEVELIALFYELVGSKLLKEYETWSLMRSETYDGRFLIKYPGLNVGSPQSDNDLSNIEFKVRLSDLVDDFDEGRKSPGAIKLIIVWRDDFGSVYRKGHANYEVIGVAGTEVEDYALQFVERCLHDRRTGGKLQILELSKIVEKLKQDTRPQVLQAA